jgi:ABC-2 type transport system ATP-binding protein
MSGTAVLGVSVGPADRAAVDAPELPPQPAVSPLLSTTSRTIPQARTPGGYDDRVTSRRRAAYPAHRSPTSVEGALSTRMGGRSTGSGTVAPPLLDGTAVPAVLLDDLSRTHRGRRGTPDVLATAGVSLTIGQGEVFGLLGPNGAGKTTLVRQLVGVLRPDSGRVTLLGHDIVREPSAAARLVAYLAQEEPALAELPVGLAIETTARLRGLSRAQARSARDDLIEELALQEVGRRPMTRLSGGQRRLAQFATALVGDRPLLVLDEPTTGLDPTARRSVWDALARRRTTTTVVLVTHNVLEAETVLDRVAVLDRGRVIASDTPGRLKAMVSDEVRLDLVWRTDPPTEDATVAMLQRRAVVNGRRWSVRLPQVDAREALGRLTSAPAFAALDDFTLATPSLEDVYLALGGRDTDLERT